MRVFGDPDYERRIRTLERRNPANISTPGGHKNLPAVGAEHVDACGDTAGSVANPVACPLQSLANNRACAGVEVEAENIILKVAGSAERRSVISLRTDEGMSAIG